MIGDARVLGVICARGGSKGLPGKNVRPLGGKPLIAWSVAAARQSGLLDRVVVSTDDDAIAEAARTAGADVPFRRPAELSDDGANLVDVVLHAVDTLAEDFRYVVLLQATSPFRSGADIDACLDLCRRTDAPSANSVCVAEQSPYWMFTQTPDGRLELLIPRERMGFRRQDLPTVYAPNGAVYACQVDWLRRERTFWLPGVTLGHLMPPERSVDIDTALDFHVAEAVREAYNLS